MLTVLLDRLAGIIAQLSNTNECDLNCIRWIVDVSNDFVRVSRRTHTSCSAKTERLFSNRLLCDHHTHTLLLSNRATATTTTTQEIKGNVKDARAFSKSNMFTDEHQQSATMAISILNALIV
jgi:hypothetical protein